MSRAAWPEPRSDFGNVDFREATIDFSGFLFGRDASFDGAEFGDEPSFYGAQFGDVASFNGAQLGYEASFDGAQFGRDAAFAGARFRLIDNLDADRQLWVELGLSTIKPLAANRRRSAVDRWSSVATSTVRKRRRPASPLV
jgi:hypothetical protein